MGDVKRNKVGPADPATRRRLLAEALRSGPPVKTAPKATNTKGAGTSPSVFDGAAHLLRRKRVIEDAVDSATGDK